MKKVINKKFSMKRVAKCSEKQWCSTMSERISDKRHGFENVNLLNLKTGIMRNIGLRYRLSGKDRGLMLNFCPWCGADIRYFKSEKMK